MNYKELILQLLIISPIFYLTQSYNSILILSITIDSIYSAIYFIKMFILNEKKSQKNLIVNLNKLYEVNIVDRYIYYLLSELLYIIIKYLFWNYRVIGLYYVL